jgi:Uma2 family endonuclease
MPKTASDYLYTYKDLEEIPYDHWHRYEIIEGELFVTPAPVPLHQRVILNLFRILDPHVQRKKLGEIFISPVDVYLEEKTVVEPDLLFLSDPSIVKRKRIEGAPDLVVEVLSKGTANRDRGIKLDAYERHGVKHYWIVDPIAKELEELVRRKKKLARRGTAKGNETFEPACFPGLEVPLKKVWAKE